MQLFKIFYRYFLFFFGVCAILSGFKNLCLINIDHVIVQE